MGKSKTASNKLSAKSDQYYIKSTRHELFEYDKGKYIPSLFQRKKKIKK